MQRMTHYCKSMIYFLTYEIIDRNFNKFIAELKVVSKFEDILDLHKQFLENILKESLLMDNVFFKLLNKLNSVCITFSKTISRFT